jgi:hypothetical protein
MEANLGMHGATHQSWHGDAIRVIVREIQEENPKANEKELVRLLGERISEDPHATKAAASYIIKNMVDAQRGYEERAKARAERNSPQERAKRTAAIAQAVQTGVNHILLLNFPQPNGKRTRHCTGTYIQKLGGAWERAGKQAGKKLLGDVFDEDSLRVCMKVDIEQ